MNKKNCALIIALLYPAYALSSGQSRRQKRTRRKQRSTFKLPEFNKEVTTREQLLWRIKQEEVLFPENSQAFENLAKLYTKLLDSPINNAKENDRWTGYRDKHRTCSEAIQNTKHLHGIKQLHKNWTTLRSSYPKNSTHYRSFDQKAFKLEYEAPKEAKKNVHTQWQKLAKRNIDTHTKKNHRTISAEEHAQLKIKTQISVISNQKDLDPLTRSTTLEALYNKLANCSSGKNQEVAHNTAQYYGNYKKRALLKEKLHQLIESDSVSIVKEAQRTAEKLRDTFPLFHANNDYYDEIAKRLKIKVAFMNKDIETLEQLKKNAAKKANIKYAQQMRKRLKFQKNLSAALKSKKAYKAVRNAAVELLSTYNKKENGFDHYLTKIVRLDLKQAITKTQSNHTILNEARYQHLLILINQMISTYPKKHPKRKTYKLMHQKTACLKNIEGYKSFILSNKNKTLNKENAIALSKAYAGLLKVCNALEQLTNDFQVTIHTCELGDLKKDAQFYTYTLLRYKLQEKLEKLETIKPLQYKKIIAVLNQLTKLPVVTSEEKNKLIAKQLHYVDLNLELIYTNKLKNLETQPIINYSECIKLIEKLRTLKTLKLDKTIKLENKLWQYRQLIKPTK